MRSLQTPWTLRRAQPSEFQSLSAELWVELLAITHACYFVNLIRIAKGDQMA